MIPHKSRPVDSCPSYTGAATPTKTGRSKGGDSPNSPGEIPKRSLLSPARHSPLPPTYSGFVSELGTSDPTLSKTLKSPASISTISSVPRKRGCSPRASSLVGNAATSPTRTEDQQIVSPLTPPALSLPVFSSPATHRRKNVLRPAPSKNWEKTCSPMRSADGEGWMDSKTFRAKRKLAVQRQQESPRSSSNPRSSQLPHRRQQRKLQRSKKTPGGRNLKSVEEYNEKENNGRQHQEDPELPLQGRTRRLSERSCSRKAAIDLVEILSSGDRLDVIEAELGYGGAVWGNISISFSPPILALSKSEHAQMLSQKRPHGDDAQGGDCGCVITSRAGQSGGSKGSGEVKNVSLSVDHLAERITLTIQQHLASNHRHGKISDVAEEEMHRRLDRAVYDLICEKEDDLNVILDAICCYRNWCELSKLPMNVGSDVNGPDAGKRTNGQANSEKDEEDGVLLVVGRDEMDWWADSPSDWAHRLDCGRHLAFVRRLLMPLCVRMVSFQPSIYRDAALAEMECLDMGKYAKYREAAFSEQNGTRSGDIELFSSSSGDDMSRATNHNLEILQKEDSSIVNGISRCTKLESERAKNQLTKSLTEKSADSGIATSRGTVNIHIVDFSLIDVLLRVDTIQRAVLQSLLTRILQIERMLQMTHEIKVKDLQQSVSEKLQSTDFACAGRTGEDESRSDGSFIPLCELYGQLQRLILSTVHRTAEQGRILDSASLISDINRILSLCPNVERLRSMVLHTLPKVILPQDISDEKVVRMKATNSTWCGESSVCRIFEHLDSRSGNVIASSFALSHKGKGNIVDYTGMEAKSCPPGQRSEREAIRKKREELIRKFKETQEKVSEVKDGQNVRRSARKILPHGRAYDGSLVITSQEMSLAEFLDRTAFMSKVNETFPRRCTPGVSRPPLQQLNLSESTVAELKSLFFDKEGRLRSSIRNEIDTSMKNDPRYITFKNRSCLIEREDKRWQVPVRKHGTGYKIATRAKVEELFQKEGVITPKCEKINDIGLLFGGTEDQSLHHDAARQMTSWLHEKPATDDVIDTLNPISGWEIDRLEYNQAMSSPYAPSSILVSLGDTHEVLLGVQKDRIARVKDGKHCKIMGGRDEIFPIVRENEFLVVIALKVGCMFTGDFPHAGVRNFRHGSPEDTLITELNTEIEHIVNEFPPHERIMRVKALIEMMCNFRGLNKFCRLHISTEMLRGHVQIPPNTIGFSDCWPNPPDPRSLEDDVIPEYKRKSWSNSENGKESVESSSAERSSFERSSSECASSEHPISERSFIGVGHVEGTNGVQALGNDERLDAQNRCNKKGVKFATRSEDPNDGGGETDDVHSKTEMSRDELVADCDEMLDLDESDNEKKEVIDMTIDSLYNRGGLDEQDIEDEEDGKVVIIDELSAIDESDSEKKVVLDEQATDQEKQEEIEYDKELVEHPSPDCNIGDFDSECSPEDE